MFWKTTWLDHWKGNYLIYYCPKFLSLYICFTWSPQIQKEIKGCTYVHRMSFHFDQKGTLWLVVAEFVKLSCSLQESGIYLLMWNNKSESISKSTLVLYFNFSSLCLKILIESRHMFRRCRFKYASSAFTRWHSLCNLERAFSTPIHL